MGTTGFGEHADARNVPDAPNLRRRAIPQP